MKMRLLIGSVVVLAVAGYCIRANVTEANTQAKAIIVADSAGQDTAASVAKIKAYVNGHMGAHASFTLQNGYTRAVAAAQAAAAAQATNSQVYSNAQSTCSGKTDSITQAKCVQTYLSSHLVEVPATGPIAVPKLADYQYKLASPLWTPDAAGLLLLAGLIGLGVAGFGLIRKRA